jgi:hypothetical protein
MGADLYNERFNKQSAEYQKAEKEFKEFSEGLDNNMSEVTRKKYIELMDKVYDHPYYFRESYGGGGLLSALDLSWWQDVIPLFDNEPEEGLTDEEYEKWSEENDINMTSDACQKFIDLLESRKHMLDAADYDYVEKGKDWFTGEEYETHVGTWYKERYARLVEFLEIGKKHGGIYASL